MFFFLFYATRLCVKIRAITYFRNKGKQKKQKRYCGETTSMLGKHFNVKRKKRSVFYHEENTQPS